MRAKRSGKELPKPRAEGEPVDRSPLIELHAGFQESSAVMVHRYGPERDYESWRIQTLDPERVGLPSFRFGGEARIFQQSARASAFSIPFECGHFTLSPAELNPAPLFGVGLIDAIPDAAIEATLKEVFVGFPGIKGRVSRLSDGRLGRFGWKAQAATLEGFVLTACAVELGLEVPGHAQAGNPRSPTYRAPGMDLTRAECEALTQFVRGLPAPAERTPSAPAEAAIVTKGRVTFERTGCAACHVPKLGPVEGIYSDLLLHEMGPQLSDTGSYDLVTPGPEENEGTLPGLMPDGPLAFRGASPRSRGLHVASGGPRRYGGCATPARTCMTVGPRPWSRRSPSTAVKPRRSRPRISNCRPGNGKLSCDFSSHWRPRPRSSLGISAARPRIS